MSDELIGKKLGLYQIVEQIGHGGMGTVYKAIQPSMNRTVAIKVLPPQLALDETFLVRFRREAQVIARLEHAHILPVYDYGESDGRVYIVMRYLDGGTLKSRIAAARLPLRDISRILRQIASALDYAHAQGVIHRDIKPANILIDAQGDAFLTDFGIAKMSEGTLDLTGNSVIGTPQYMSPEQGQSLKIDARSDVYALGVVLYETLAGRVPYTADTPLAIVVQHMTAPLPAVREHAPNLPESIETVIKKALAKQPAERYATAGELTDAFENVLQFDLHPATLPLKLDQPDTLQADVTLPELPHASMRRVLPVVAVLVVIGSILGIAFATRPPALSPTPTVTIAITPSPVPVVEALLEDGCELLLFDDFGDVTSGFPRGESRTAAWGYLDGAYGISIKQSNQFEARALRESFGDYTVEVDAYLATDTPGSYGLILSADAVATSYYAFAVDHERNFVVTQRTRTTSTIVRNWMFAPSLNDGLEPNRLRVIHQDGSISFYANDVLFAVVTDTLGLGETHIGLIASSFGSRDVDARFDNFRVCRAREPSVSNEVSLLDTFDDDRNLWRSVRYPAGSAFIEDGQFQLVVPYQDIGYALLHWNPTFVTGDFELEVESRVLGGADDVKAGVLFGVQDVDNGYIAYASADGRLSLFNRIDGDQRTIFRDQREEAIRTNGGLNRWRLRVSEDILTVWLNDIWVLDESIEYTPGAIGFACEATVTQSTTVSSEPTVSPQPTASLEATSIPPARCSFDNLAVHGVPVMTDVAVYPFCNCRRDVRIGQPVFVTWTWNASVPELINEFQTMVELDITVDGEPLADSRQYWSEIEVDTEADGVKSNWVFAMPPLSAGSHIFQITVSSKDILTDGHDANGDGRPDTFGPGEFSSGYVQIIVAP